MDCKKFREKISSGADFDEELIKHKEDCKECQEWLNKELSTAPTGISSEDWNKAVSKCLPNEGNKKQKSQNNQEKELKNQSNENKTFMDYYLSGLKYGIVFGLAIVVGFAIIQNKNETNSNSKTVSNGANLASDTINLATDSANLPIDSGSEIIMLPGQK